eukprot:CAMPEP_0181221664 /NCGR_PEP_ID=MMETSP1096-20121128/29534_1 /TAXON_ID=156174 ORGANISM="Chrysochromulina ericina, Strain CCMP281" /NCGR_SAMPLE_ID=MMETSP1096 /ASSEMBLY_ACC=CAM_ASM_000453 /LENGTH=86 /DNA_ID=CAMNT_0023314335 /DNA_START=484 /DNA_END=745 /DNA_ORIENTATION=-
MVMASGAVATDVDEATVGATLGGGAGAAGAMDARPTPLSPVADGGLGAEGARDGDRVGWARGWLAPFVSPPCLGRSHRRGSGRGGE